MRVPPDPPSGNGVAVRATRSLTPLLDDAQVPDAPRLLPRVEVLEERDQALPRQAEEVAEAAHGERLPLDGSELRDGILDGLLVDDELGRETHEGPRLHEVPDEPLDDGRLGAEGARELFAPSRVEAPAPVVLRDPRGEAGRRPGEIAARRARRSDTVAVEGDAPRGREDLEPALERRGGKPAAEPLEELAARHRERRRAGRLPLREDGRRAPRHVLGGGARREEAGRDLQRAA